MFTNYFTFVQQTCFIDEGKVYLSGERVSIDNTYRNGYIRHDGELTFTALDVCSGVYLVNTPLVFVGAVPGCTQDTVYDEVLEELSLCGLEPKSLTFDKQEIAESEGIERQDLAKFDGVVLVRVEFDVEATKIYNKNCDVELCLC